MSPSALDPQDTTPLDSAPEPAPSISTSERCSQGQVIPSQKTRSDLGAPVRPDSGSLGKGALAAMVALVGTLLPNVPATAQDPPATPPQPPVPRPATAPTPSTGPAPATAPATPNGAPTTQLPELEVTGQGGYSVDSLSMPKFSEPLLTNPQTAEVVTQEVMQDEGTTMLRDALRNVAGVSIGAGEGSYQGDNISIRGFSARSDIFVDGMRDMGSYFRDPFDVQEVEVLKGASSAEFGRGSTGGAVNMEMKTPQLDGFTAGSLMYGTDDTFRETLDVDQPIPGIPYAAFRLNLMSDDAHVADRDGVDYKRWGAAPSVAFGLGTDTRVIISYFHESEDNVPDYGIPWFFDRPAPVAQNNFYGFKSDYDKTNVNLGTLKFEHDFNDHVTLREQLRVSSEYADYRVTEPQQPANAVPTTPLSQQQVERNMIDGVDTYRAVDEDIELDCKFSTGDIKHHLLVGFEYVHECDDPVRIEPGWENVSNTSLVSPDDNNPFTGYGPVSEITNASVNTLSLYAIDTMKWGDKWTLIGGLRFDRISSEYYESVPPVSAFGSEDQALTWRGALVYQPQPNGSVYVAAGTSVHPNVAQLSLMSETTLPASTASIATGENVDMEVGTKWQFFDSRLTLSGALFYDTQTNPAAEDADEPLILVLHGKERVEGFELGAVGKLTDKWKVLANYTFEPSDVLSASLPGFVGNPVYNCPEQTWSLWTTYDLPWKFQIGAGANSVSSRNGSEQTDPLNGLIEQVPGYIIFNAMLKYRINDNVSVQLNVTNLANTYYYDGVHYGHVVPGEGRALFLSTNFKF